MCGSIIFLSVFSDKSSDGVKNELRKKSTTNKIRGNFILGCVDVATVSALSLKINNN